MDESLVSLGPTIDLLSQYDSFDLLQTVSGLQLAPENAARAIRLEVIAHIIASISTSSTSKLKASKLREILNSHPFANSEIESQEDPVDGLFAEGFSFHGGTYVTLPGISEDANFILRHMAKAIWFDPVLKSHREFLHNTTLLITVVLLISNEIAKRADIERGIESNSPSRGRVIFPTNLLQLKNAVTFTKAELLSMFGLSDEIPEVLQKLIISQGSFIYDKVEFDKGELLRRPIVQFNSQYIVAIPGNLLVALRHQILQMAIESKLLEAFISAYANEVWQTVLESFRRLGNDYLYSDLPTCNEPRHYRDGLFQLDTDKLVYAGLLIDPLDNYDPEDPFSTWNTQDEVSSLNKHWRKIEEILYSKPFALNEWLCVFVHMGFARTAAIGFNGSETVSNVPFLPLMASDLDTISWLESDKRLALWNYALASDRARDRSRVLSWSQLDEFHLFRRNRYSYYFTDNALPTLIMIDPGGADELRKEVARKRDFHSVDSYMDGYLCEVSTLHGSKDVPIYIDEYSINGEQLAILVEKLPFPVWIISPDLQQKNQQHLRGLYVSFVDSISHWIWQLSPALAPILDTISNIYQKIIIQVTLDDSPGWFSIAEPSVGADPVIVESAHSKGQLQIKINATICPVLMGAENIGERMLMREVLVGLRELLSDSGYLTDQIISELVDEYIPQGQKKKILLLHAHVSPDLDAEGIPKYQPMSEGEIEQLLDELGVHLDEIKQIPKGNISGSQLGEIFVAIVDFFYTELIDLLSTLRPVNLLEWLIAHNESIIHEIADYRLTIPTRLACFISEKELIEELERKQPELTSTAVSSRFLIELVGSSITQGIRPISSSVYNRMLALSNEIIEFGMESDLIHFKLADFEFSILPSGRFGADRKKMMIARDAYFSIYNAREIRRFSNRFTSLWDESPEKKGESAELAEINSATKAEFGYSLVELVSFLGEVYNLSIENNWHSVGKMSISEFIETLSSRLKRTKKDVKNIADLLSLKPRSNFLKPNKPFKPEDVYPWRYNRPLSYLRTPLIIRPTEQGQEILWGPRNLYNAWQYLIDLCLNGRLRAHTKEMRQYQGKINNEKGLEFNEKVFEWFQRASGLNVKKHVKKIGKRPISDKEGELGDIDVLVIDPKKRLILVIECKSLALARTPNELSNELTFLFEGSESKKSTVEKHSKRTRWINDNLYYILEIGKISTKGKWKVESRIVVDVPLFTPYLRKFPIKVISFNELAEYFPQYV